MIADPCGASCPDPLTFKGDIRTAEPPAILHPSDSGACEPARPRARLSAFWHLLQPRTQRARVVRRRALLMVDHDVCRPQRGDRGDRPPRRFDGPPGGGGGYRESRFGSREGGGGFGRGGGDKVSLTASHSACWSPQSSLPWTLTTAQWPLPSAAPKYKALVVLSTVAHHLPLHGQSLAGTTLTSRLVDLVWARQSCGIACVQLL